MKQTVCKVLKIFQYRKYLVAYVLKNRFEKVPVPELIKKTCLATMNRYVDGIFLHTISKLKIFFCTYDVIHYL